MTVTNQTVASTAIAAVSYDDETEEMTVTFHGGGKVNYVLQGVPEIEFQRLIGADSVGGYWNSFLKGNY